jgi:ribosomal-protein-alanine N-acetyltransferase
MNWRCGEPLSTLHEGDSRMHRTGVSVSDEGDRRDSAVMTGMQEIDAGRVLLRPIDVETARTVLDGRIPNGVLFASDWPSQFSLEVMDLVAGARAGEVRQFGPFFLVHKTDGVVIGEIGAVVDPAKETAQVGYSLVESSWGQGYATEALKALLSELLARGVVRRVVGETYADHHASRRVMEKAGMHHCGERTGEEAGQPVELMVYELVR